MNKDLLQEASQALMIVDVFLATSHSYLKDGWLPFLPPEKQLEIQFRNSPKTFRVHTLDALGVGDTDMIEFSYDVGFRFISSDLDEAILQDEKILAEHVLAEVTATFISVYKQSSSVSTDALNEFGTYNVGYHVWPYWREYASNMANRLRLPHFILPLYKLPS